MAENYVIRPGQPGAANKPTTELPYRHGINEYGKYTQGYIRKLINRGLITKGPATRNRDGDRLFGTFDSIIDPRGSLPATTTNNGLYTYSPIAVDVPGNWDEYGFIKRTNDWNNFATGIQPGGVSSTTPGTGIRTAQYINGLISEYEYFNYPLDRDPTQGRGYSPSSPVGRIIQTIPPKFRVAVTNNNSKGNLISDTDNPGWWSSLSDLEKRAVIFHNREVVAAYGSWELAVAGGVISPQGNATGINSNTPWVIVGGKPTAPASSGERNSSAFYPVQPPSTPLGDGGTVSTPGVGPGDSATTSGDAASGASSGAAASADPPTSIVDPRAQVAAANSGVNVNGTPQLNSWGLSALQTNNILSNTDAVTRFLMQQNGQYSPSLGSQLSGPMSAMPMMYLLDNANTLSFDPNSLDTSSSESLTSSLLNQVLGGEGSLNYANQFMQNQTQGSGIDPVAALQKLFMVGDPDQSSNVLTEFLGNGSQGTQIETTKNFITASLANANPYIAGVIATLVDSLGNQYLASGGSPNGFLDWLAKNSFFNNFVVAR